MVRIRQHRMGRRATHGSTSAPASPSFCSPLRGRHVGWSRSPGLREARLCCIASTAPRAPAGTSSPPGATARAARYLECEEASCGIPVQWPHGERAVERVLQPAPQPLVATARPGGDRFRDRREPSTFDPRRVPDAASGKGPDRAPRRAERAGRSRPPNAATCRRRGVSWRRVRARPCSRAIWCAGRFCGCHW